MKKMKKFLLSLACMGIAFNVLAVTSCDFLAFLPEMGEQSTSESGETSETSGSENNSDNNSEIEGEDDSSSAENEENSSVNENQGDLNVKGSEGLTYKRKGDYYCVLSIGTCKDEQVVVPKTYEGLPVKRILSTAFCNQDFIKSIVIAEGIEYIEESGISQCVNLEKVTLPKTLHSIDQGVFDFCLALKEISVAEDSEIYKSVDGDLYTKDGGVLVKYAVGKKATSFAVPEGVVSIHARAFMDAKHLTSVTFPEGVTSIGHGAFDGCENLRAIALPKSLTTLGTGAFIECTGLTEISVDKDNQYYKLVDGNLYTKDGKKLIQYVGNVETEIFTIPNGVESIEYGAICEKNIKKLVIPVSVKTFESFGLSNMPNLKEVFYGGDVEAWEKVELEMGVDFANAVFYYYSEAKPIGMGNYWRYDEMGKISIWPVEAPSNGTYTFESEYTYFGEDTMYLGWMGTAYGNSCIERTSQEGIYYAGYVYKKGTAITFRINATEAVENVTLKVRVATVYKTNVTFGPTGEYAWKVAVNGTALNYTPFLHDGVIDKNGPEYLLSEFKTHTLSTTVSLQKGENVIEFITDNTNKVYGTMEGFAPVIDHIQLVTKEDVVLSYDPIYSNIG